MSVCSICGYGGNLSPQVDVQQSLGRGSWGSIWTAMLIIVYPSTTCQDVVEIISNLHKVPLVVLNFILQSCSGENQTLQYPHCVLVCLFVCLFFVVFSVIEILISGDRTWPVSSRREALSAEQAGWQSIRALWMAAWCNILERMESVVVIYIYIYSNGVMYFRKNEKLLNIVERVI